MVVVLVGMVACAKSGIARSKASDCDFTSGPPLSTSGTHRSWNHTLRSDTHHSNKNYHPNQALSIPPRFITGSIPQTPKP
eukprot:3792925-Amphidinium_carterae.1